MLDSFTHPLTLPDYSSLKSQEGKGNWAIKKYYHYPWRPFYRHKLRMIVDMMDERKYENILDFGSGPGIFTKELRKHAWIVKSVDLNDAIDQRAKFDLIVCSSVLEFVNLDYTLKMLLELLRFRGQIIIASPMDTFLSRSYFDLIGDANIRNSHEKIINAVMKQFGNCHYRTWLGLYFSAKAYKK